MWEKVLGIIMMALMAFGIVGAGISMENVELIAGETAAEETTVAEEATYNFEKIIFYGDSRFAYMAQAASNPSEFVAQAGATYEWMESHLYDVLEKYTEDSVIVIEFGINDPWDYELYIEFANKLASQGYQVAYLTIMPIDEELTESEWGYELKNSHIEAFNEVLKASLDPSIIILDGYSYLKQVGYETYDGLHFTGATSNKIYRFITTSLKAQ